MSKRVRAVQPSAFIWLLPFLAIAAATTVERLTLSSAIAASHGVLFLGVGATAMAAGLWPSVLASALAFLAAHFLNVGPGGHFELADAAEGLADVEFFLICFCAAGVGSFLHKKHVAVKKSTERLGAVFDKAGVGILEVDDKGGVLAANSRACAILGYSRDEFPGMNVRELTWSEDRDMSEQISEDLRAGRRESVDFEKRYVGKDGSPIWVHVTVRPIQYGKGRRFIETIVDMRERKRAEDALRESERRYRIVADNADSWEFWMDPSGAFLYNSPSCEQVTGYRSEAFAADRGLFQRIIYADDRHCFAEHHDKDKGCVTEEARFRIVRRDGGLRWIHHTCRPVYDSNGGYLGTRGSNRDITAQEEAEARIKRLNSELQRQNAALDAERERWHAIVASIAEEVWVCDADGRMTLLNVDPRGTHMKLAEFSDKSVHEVLQEVDILTLDGKERPPEQAPLLRSLRGEIVFGEEIMRHRRTGVTRYRQFTSSPVRSPQGKIAGAVAVVRDVTATKELERALDQARCTAEAANAAKDQFLAVLSHELRTPLTPVLAAVALVERQEEISPGIHRALEIIRRNVALEARIIDDLLDVTRIARGKITLERKQIAIAELLTRVVEVCKPDIETRKLRLDITEPWPDAVVYGDVSRLQQIFWNLLKNAIKFTPEAGSIELRAWKQDEKVLVEVKDSGIGIDAAVLPKIFDAFEQGGQGITRQFGGLGLGLAIAKRLVELHGGEVYAESGGKGCGAIFRVGLPAIQMEARMVSEASQQGLPARSGAKHILLVEDHGDTAQLMRALLEGLGHEVEVAGDVAEGLKAASLSRFDLLISDLGLPDKSGLELMQELRARGNGLRAIALSGYGREEDVRKSKEAGFIEHLTKPVDFEVLEEALDRVSKV